MRKLNTLRQHYLRLIDIREVEIREGRYNDEDDAIIKAAHQALVEQVEIELKEDGL